MNTSRDRVPVDGRRKKGWGGTFYQNRRNEFIAGIK